MGKVLTTITNVAVAVSVSATIWVGANLLFNQAREDWRRFNTLVGAFAGFALLGILHGNRLIEDFGFTSNDVGWFLAWIWMPVIGAITGGGVGWSWPAPTIPTPDGWSPPVRAW